MKKRPLFKNDQFGIRWKLFLIRYNRHWRKTAKLKGKIIEYCLKNIRKIGYPKDDEYKDLLRQVLELYDKTVADAEKYLKNARDYVKEWAYEKTSNCLHNFYDNCILYFIFSISRKTFYTYAFWHSLFGRFRNIYICKSEQWIWVWIKKRIKRLSLKLYLQCHFKKPLEILIL